MTTISTSRPAISGAAQARPQGPTAGGAPAGAALDPVRLVKRYKWILAVAAVGGAVLGFGMYQVLKRVSPSYRSQVMYMATPPITQMSGVENQQVDREEFERFVTTEAMTMRSEAVLRKAINNRDVQQRTQWIQGYLSQGVPNENAAYRELVKIVGTNAVTGTRFIQMSVSAPVAEDAQILATAVHEAYFDDLAARQRTISTESREVLSKRLTVITDEVTRLENANRTKYTEAQIEGSGQGNEEGEFMALVQAQDKLSEAIQRLTTAKEEQKSLNNLAKGGAGGGGVQYNDTQRDMAERDPLVVDLKQKLASLETSERAMIADGKGENHRDRQQLKAQLDSTREQLDEERRKALEKIFAADVDGADRAVRANEAIVKESQTRITELQQARAKKALAKLEVQQNEARIAKLREEQTKAEAALGELEMLSNLRTTDRIGRIRRMQAPRLPEQLAFPRMEIMIPIGILLGLGATLTFLIARELVDQRVRGASDIGLIPRLRVLGVVPDASEDPSKPASVATAFKDAPTGAISEAFRHLRAPIAKRMHQAGYKTLLVLAGSPDSGASCAVANIAMQAAATETRVLVIDANMRRPSLHSIFKLGEGPGLGEVLTKKATFDQAVQQTSHANLSLLSAGSPASRNVPERLATESMTQLLQEAAGKYDLVLIDSAPALVAGDGVSLANRADAVIMVVRAGSDKRGFIARMRDQLSDARAELLGVIVNGVKGTAGGYLKKNIRTAFEYQAGERA